MINTCQDEFVPEGCKDLQGSHNWREGLGTGLGQAYKPISAVRPVQGYLGTAPNPGWTLG